jgi:apolipoprotein N-acyltransferase
MKRDVFFSFFSAALLILSFPPANLWIFAWVGFVPLFFALKNKSKFKAFLLSYLTGVIFWFGIIYWLIHVTLLGMILLVLYLALYFAFFGLIVSRRSVLCTWYSVLFIPSLWVVLEYLRSHLLTGFPWALLGYSQYLNLPIIQIADITGVWGVSFLVMMVNLLVYQVLSTVYRASVLRKNKKETLSIITWFLPFLIIFLSLGYGFYKLSATPNTEHRTPIKISVIQGNIPQELKWDPNSKDFIIDRYISLTRQALKDRPDLIVWPEAALPVVLEEEPVFYEKTKDFVREIKIPLLLGAVTSKDNLYYNSALLISAEGRLLYKYDKLHLVPFGEYIPLRKTLGFLQTVVPIGDFSRGKDYTIFKVPSTEYQVQSRETQNNFAVLICFEDLFPQLSREFIKRGADFLINITNDAWFKMTSSPYQHLQASVFRAVENRVALIRSANTGVSGFIAPTGKIISLVEDRKGRNIFISGYDTEEIIIRKRSLSFYTQHPDVFIIACFLIVLFGMVPRIKSKS